MNIQLHFSDGELQIMTLERTAGLHLLQLEYFWMSTSQIFMISILNYKSRDLWQKSKTLAFSSITEKWDFQEVQRSSQNFTC